MKNLNSAPMFFLFTIAALLLGKWLAVSKAPGATSRNQSWLSTGLATTSPVQLSISTGGG